MKIKDFDDAMFWWLEEIPVDEIEDQEAQKIIGEYREGAYDVLCASELLEVYCQKSIKKWIDLNREFSRMLK